MKAVSIFNHVIGPVMRGPSSSHAAGAFHIGAMARSFAGGTPKAVVIAFDADGSCAKCYREQGADLAFAASGSAEQASDAAAIAFQNTMGFVCDLVQGIVEIPCHTRNAAAASNAFLCADLILGGYANPIPLK